MPLERKIKMHILSEGRKDFLDFLRNLTPQTIILSMSILAFQKININEQLYTAENLNRILLGTICGLIWLTAAYCNITLFLENSIRTPELDKDKKHTWKDDLKRFERNIRTCWTLKKSVFLEVAVTIIIIEFSTIIIIFNAIKIAAGFLRR